MMLRAVGGGAYLLDTDVVSCLFDIGHSSHAVVASNIRSVDARSIFGVSVLTRYELAYAEHLTPAFAGVQGWLDDLVEDPSEPLPDRSAPLFAELKSQLARVTGQRPTSLSRHNVDLLIATTAIAGGWTLVSGDAIHRQLASVRTDLSVEDWTIP